MGRKGKKLRIAVIKAREVQLTTDPKVAATWPLYLGLEKKTYVRVVDDGGSAIESTRRIIASTLKVNNPDFLIAGKQWQGRDVPDEEILQWIKAGLLRPPEPTSNSEPATNSARPAQTPTEVMLPEPVMNAPAMQPAHPLTDGGGRVSSDSHESPRTHLMAAKETLSYHVDSVSSQTGLGQLHHVPALPEPCIPRLDEIDQLRRLLLQPRPDPVASPIRLVISGMGGLGKSAMAAMLAHDETVRRRFPDGVLWTSLGTHPNLEGRLEDLCRTLDPTFRFTDQDAISRSRELKRLLASKACLLILDNVWNQSHANLFDAEGPDCALLITTRTTSIATALRATPYEPAMLSHEVALRLLAGYGGFAPNTPPPEAEQVVRCCRGHALALVLCGAMVRDGAADWQTLERHLIQGDLDSLEHQDGQLNLVRCLRLSVDLLAPQERQCFTSLAVFNESDAVPEPAVANFWISQQGLTPLECMKLLFKLKDRNLIRMEGKAPNRTIRLHDLIKSCARSLIPDPRLLHDELIAAYHKLALNGWHGIEDDGYFFAHFPRHLHAADKLDPLRERLLDFHWLEAKLRHCGVFALQRDLALIPGDPALALVQRALQQCIDVLADDRSQLASQLVANLNGCPQPEVRQLLRTARSWRAIPWIALVPPASLAPAPAFIKSYVLNQSVRHRLGWLAANHFRAKHVAVSVDERLVAAVFDYSGRDVGGDDDFLLNSPHGSVPNGAVPRTRLEVWDLQQDCRVFEKDYSELGAEQVAFLADCRTLLLLFSDQTVGLLDTHSGEQQPLPTTQSGPVRCAAVSGDGRVAMLTVPGHGLLQWNGTTITFVPLPLERVQEITALVLNQHGTQAVCALGNELCHWRQTTPEELVSQALYPYAVESLDLSPDGRQACCFVETKGHPSFHRGKVHLWSLTEGRELATFTAEKGIVLRFDADDEHLHFCNYGPLSGIWNPTSNELVNAFPTHSMGAGALRVLPRSGQLLTLGHESRLKLWTVEKLKQEDSRGWDRISEIRAASQEVTCAVRSFSGRVRVLQNGTFLDWECKVPEYIGAMDLTADGQRIVTGEHPHNICLRSASTGEILSEFSNVNVGTTTALRFAEKDRRIIFAAPDWLFGLPIDRDHQIQRGWVQPQLRTCHAIAILADDRHFATWTNTIDIRTVDSGRIIHSHYYGDKRQFGNARALEASADNRFVAASFFDGRILVWDMQAEMEWLGQHAGEPASTKGDPDPDFGCWDSRLMTPRIDSVRMFYPGNTEAFGLAISPNSRWLCAGLLDGTLRCWDLHTGDQIAVFHAEWPIEACRFGPDSQTILAGNGLGQILEFRLRAFPAVTAVQGVPPQHHWPPPPPNTPGLEAHEKACYDKWQLPGIWEYY